MAITAAVVAKPIPLRRILFTVVSPSCRCEGGYLNRWRGGKGFSIRNDSMSADISGARKQDRAAADAPSSGVAQRAPDGSSARKATNADHASGIRTSLQRSVSEETTQKPQSCKPTSGRARTLSPDIDGRVLPVEGSTR